MKTNYIKTFIISIFICLSFVSLTFANDVGDKIKQDCINEWPGNYRMQKYCYDKQVKSFRTYMEKYHFPYVKGKSIDELNKCEEALIILRCYTEWGDNWRMVLYCCDKQFEAYNQMKRY